MAEYQCQQGKSFPCNLNCDIHGCMPSKAYMRMVFTTYQTNKKFGVTIPEIAKMYGIKEQDILDFGLDEYERLENL